MALLTASHSLRVARYSPGARRCGPGSPRAGFTIIELLVGIVIVGLLMSLIVPAVESAREASRRTQCRNNLKQVGLAILSHESAYGQFPSNGWGYLWVGDPDRGVGRQQPGGWIYQILPHADAGPVAAIGARLTGLAKEDALALLAESPLPVFNCPSRSGGARSLALPQQMHNATWTPLVAKTDYAINEGDYITDTREGPPSLAAGDSPGYPWQDVSQATGVSFLRSEIRPQNIHDGMSNTYLVGEKYVRFDAYCTAADAGHDQTMYSGVDLDINRWTIDPPLPDDDIVAYRRFGSAHADARHFVMCDGSVRSIAYSIDAELHRDLGHRKDSVPAGGF